MEKFEPVVIFKTQNTVEASMIYEILKSEGIDCFILDKNAGAITGGIAISSKIAVAPKQKEEALEIIKAFLLK
ncbi:MAG: DUF2007 domain-containing protein [Elusimicrobia bacterium]|nr:DUF2007 domain-containing protein [Elusimicrobiota bacterium]